MMSERISPSSRRQRLNTARLLMEASNSLRLGQPSKAIERCESVLGSDPNHLGALEVLAKALWQIANYPQLAQVTKRLISLNPFEPGYFGLRGMALRALGQYGEAAKCLARDPQAADALADLEAFQTTLVADLISLDPTFAASFKQNSNHALEARGLATTHIPAQKATLISKGVGRPNFVRYC